MRRTLIFLVVAISFFGCNKDNFNPENPNAEIFARQLRDGSYDNYLIGENREKLWTIMPDFKNRDIPVLIELSKDTSLVCPCEHFPTNPISSIPPYRIVEGNTCIILGEFLLWCVEGIIKEKDFASLTPILVDLDRNPGARLSGTEILYVRNIYQDWWDEYGEAGNIGKYPLEETQYRWR